MLAAFISNGQIAILTPGIENVVWLVEGVFKLGGKGGACAVFVSLASALMFISRCAVTKVDQMSRKPLLQQLMETSARLGSLFIPGGSLESVVGRFAHPLMALTGDDLFKVQLLGSSTGLVHSGKPRLVCSKHQLKNVVLSEVGMLAPDGGNLLTSSGSRTFHDGEHHQESDAFDLAAFDFTEPACEHPELFRHFFDFDQVPPDTKNSDIIAYVVAGYPSRDQKYELEEANHLGLVRRVLVAVPAGHSADPALIKLKFAQPLDFDPDGLSGGPAFVILDQRGVHRVFLAGMTVRAGTSDCYILKSGSVWDVLRSFE